MSSLVVQPFFAAPLSCPPQHPAQATEKSLQSWISHIEGIDVALLGARLCVQHAAMMRARTPVWMSN